MRRDQRLRLDAEIPGASKEIGLVPFQETEHGGQHRGLGRPRAQVGGIEAGDVQQPLRTVRLAQRPDQRMQAERGGVFVCVVGAHCLSGVAEGTPRVAKKVLVVEDNELNLKLFCDLMRAHGWTAEPVRDGREGVARAREVRPDLIVMDIQMPHVTGYELILDLKADEGLRAIPIMAVTAYAGREDEERIRGAGADAYVSKPISLARFMDAVNALA